MTILLAFFIIMLTLGRDRVSQYKSGIGQISNLMGIEGGTGVLEFWRSMRRPPAKNIFTTEEKKDAMLVGYERGERDSFTLTETDVKRIVFEDPRRTYRIHSAIAFDPGHLRIRRDTQFALDQMATLLYSLKKSRIVIEVYVNTGNPAADRKLAAQRAAWLTRHLIENANIPADKIGSIGRCRLLENEQGSPPPQVTFLVKRLQQDSPPPVTGTIGG
jgi:hypothetical protein